MCCTPTRRHYHSHMVRGDMVFFINAKNTQTTAWRVLTEPTEHTCKALASVEAPTLRNTYDFCWKKALPAPELAALEAAALVEADVGHEPVKSFSGRCAEPLAPAP